MDWSDLGLPEHQVMLLDEKEVGRINHFICNLRDVGDDDDGDEEEERKRKVDHIKAEQRRRGKIKNELERLKQLVPALQVPSNVRCSQSRILQEGNFFFAHY